MSDTAEHKVSNWFTPSRFGILLALLVVASFPQVVLGFKTFIVRDYGFFAYPLAHFQKDCFWHGEIPFWDSYNNCGIPFLAQWNTMPLYPPSLIYLLLPLTWSLSFFCLLHLWFGGLGMYFLARKWTGNNFAAAFAGTAFSFSGMTLNLLMWPSHTATWAWMPWVLLAVEGAWRKGGRTIFIAAICGALQMLAGGPEIIFFTWLILLALWIQQLAKNEFPRQAFWRFPAVVALVTMMAAAQLLPFLDLAAHSQRQAGYADLRWSMPGRGLANFLVPMAFGRIHGEGIFFQHNQGWTTSYYLGIGTLWLALLGAWKCRNRRVWLLMVVAAVAIFCALGGNTPVLPIIRKIFPQLAFVTYPVKYLLLVAFIAPLLAAFYLARSQEQKNQKPIAVVGASLLLLIAGVTFWATRFPLMNDEAHPALLNGISRAVFLVLIAAILFVLTRKSESVFTKLAPLALILIAWLDVLTHEPWQNPTVSAVPPDVYQINLAREKLKMEPQPETGGSRAMVSPKAFRDFIELSLLDPKNNFLAKRLGYCANCNLLDGVPKVEGFFSLTPRENNDLISLLYSTTNDYPRLDDFMGVSQITAPDEMYDWQARQTFLPLVTAGQKPIFLDDESTLRGLTAGDFDGGNVVFLPPEAKPFVTVTNQTGARIVSSRFGTQSVEIEVDAPAPSLVVVAQTFYHDWHASVDGQSVPLLRANDAFQAIEVDQGKHHVSLFYKDHAFEMGLVLSSIGWLGCLFGSLCLPRRGALKRATDIPPAS
jgi:Bacterial membrane protein YfhO